LTPFLVDRPVCSPPHQPSAYHDSSTTAPNPSVFVWGLRSPTPGRLLIPNYVVPTLYPELVFFPTPYSASVIHSEEGEPLSVLSRKALLLEIRDAGSGRLMIRTALAIFRVSHSSLYGCWPKSDAKGGEKMSRPLQVFSGGEHFLLTPLLDLAASCLLRCDSGSHARPLDRLIGPHSVFWRSTSLCLTQRRRHHLFESRRPTNQFRR